MFVPFIPYDTVQDFTLLSEAAEMLNTTVSVVEEKCRQYFVTISQSLSGPGLERKNFITLHRHLFDERPWKPNSRR